MPGTRTAPASDGAVTGLEYRFKMVDAHGDLIAITSPTDNGGGGFFSGSEAVAAALQAASNASLYSIRLSYLYEGVRSHTNALKAVRSSVDGAIVYHAKDAERNNMRARIPAPIASLFVPNTETPDASDAEIVAWMAAWDAAWSGTFGGVSLRFTEGRDINKKVDL